MAKKKTSKAAPKKAAPKAKVEEAPKVAAPKKEEKKESPKKSDKPMWKGREYEVLQNLGSDHVHVRFSDGSTHTLRRGIDGVPKL